MTSFWFEVFVVIGLIAIIWELSSIKRTYAAVETAKIEQRENK